MTAKYETSYDNFVSLKAAIRMRDLGFDNMPCLGVFYGNIPTTIEAVDAFMEEYGSMQSDRWMFFEEHFSLESRSTQYYARKGYQNGILVPLWQQAVSFLLPFLNGDPIHRIIVSKKDGSYILQDSLDPHGWQNVSDGSNEDCIDKLLNVVELKQRQSIKWK